MWEKETALGGERCEEKTEYSRWDELHEPVMGP